VRFVGSAGLSLETGSSIDAHNEALKNEGLRIITEANKRGFHLRFLGAMAFQTHCPKYNYLTLRMRRMLTDVDFAGYGKERDRVSSMMRELGYADQPAIAALWGDRAIWDHKTNGTHVDIFLEKLAMNHTILFENRLELEPFTIPLEDMLVEKMQIVQINEKDITDTIMLLREHEIGMEKAPETIDAQYIARLLSKDWGFFYTFTTNLAKVRDRVDSTKELGEDDKADVNKKIQSVIDIVEKEPKTFGWKMRAKVGIKKKWYNEVEEVRR
jgi:hypothetical protein